MSLKTPTSLSCKLHHLSQLNLFCRPLFAHLSQATSLFSIFHNASVDTKCVAVVVHSSIVRIIGLLGMAVISKALRMLFNVCLPGRAGLFCLRSYRPVALSFVSSNEMENCIAYRVSKQRWPLMVDDLCFSAVSQTCCCFVMSSSC